MQSKVSVYPVYRQILLVSLLLVSTTLLQLLPGGITQPRAAHADGITLSKAAYRDKTLAGFLSEVAGVLTGYEFVRDNTSPLPDQWFTNDFLNGPYTGSNPYWQPTDAEHHRLPQNGDVLSYDNYQIDFFNQFILQDHGPNPSAKDIRDEWAAHQVSDWGGGQEAEPLAAQGVLPPFIGKSEWNYLYWCTEPYLENDTLGLDAPGMPQTTGNLIDTFAPVSGEGDAIIWAKFIATMESLAYTDTSGDIRVVMSNAAAVLPQNSWPYQIYQYAQLQHNQTSDWHQAVKNIQKFQRFVYGQDDPMAIPDVNNAFLITAILYGNNDYLTTANIAALTNFDGEDQTGAVLAIMGVLKGMSGLPADVSQAITNRILLSDQSGVYQNDPNIRPHIGANYPVTQKWTDILNRFQSNAEDEITANGGSIDANNYYLPVQTVSAPATVLINNADFEHGDLAGWSSSPAPDGVHVYAQNNGTAQTGNWKGTLATDSSVPEAKLWVTLHNLQPGATYRATAFLEGSAEARLYADNYGGSYIYSSAYGQASPAGHTGYWVSRSIYFTPTGSTANVGVHLPSNGTNWAAIDNLSVVRVTQPASVRYEAEQATINGGQVETSSNASNGAYVGGLNAVGSYVQFPQVSVPATREYRVTVNYANGYTSNGTLHLYVNGNNYATLLVPRTGNWGTFSQTTLEIPVVLTAGNNTITLQKDATGDNYVELDYIDVSDFPTVVAGSSMTGNQPNLLTNPGFEHDAPTQTPIGWSVWPGNAGTDANASYTETGSHTGVYRLTHYKNVAYEVYTFQTVTNVPNGTYTASAWVVSGSNMIADYMDVKDYGGSALQATISNTGWPNWTLITISNIQVTNGQVTLGFYSKGNANDWMSVDDVELVQQS